MRQSSEIVDLHQIDAIGAHQLERALHLRDAGGAAARPHLRGEKGALAVATLEQFADDSFGAAIHRRAVEHRAARAEQRGEHIGQALVAGAADADVEAEIGAAADDGQLLAGRRDGARFHRSAAFEVRLAFFAERHDALAEVAGLAGRRLQLGFELELFVERVVETFPVGLAQQCERGGRPFA